MPRVKGPLLSLAVSGTFRDLMEFRMVGGQSVVCGTRTPTKRPPSAAQLQRRERFMQAKDAWNDADDLLKAQWNSAANGTGRSGYQLWISEWFIQDIFPPNQPLIPA